jgi:hypothetical protein
MEYDIKIVVSGMLAPEGLETSIDIFQLAEHFEYLNYKTKQTHCSNV